MMTHAYPEIYLSSAMRHIGESFDYAINDCKIKGSDYFSMFLISKISLRIENGEPLYLKGKSGIEIARDIIYETTLREEETEQVIKYEKNKEYWIGYAITYYQWYTDRSFYDILLAFSYEELEMMYYTLHEADINKFVDIVQEKLQNCLSETNLKRIRKEFGISQSELAKQSGVSLRSIQAYEQRDKDINKASGETLYMLSKALGCKIENLIEK